MGRKPDFRVYAGCFCISGWYDDLKHKTSFCIQRSYVTQKRFRRRHIYCSRGELEDLLGLIVEALDNDPSRAVMN